MEKCIIGVDGGGTKTKAVAYKVNRETVGETYGGHGSFVVSEQEATDNINNILDKLVKEINDFEIAGIYMGLSGWGGYNNKEKFIKSLEEKFNTKVRIENDAVIALYTVIKDKTENGILALAGTGSACFGIKGDKILLTGGWGHLIGDEGGAYNIAISAIRKMVDDEDCGREPSDLSKKIMSKLGLESIFDIKGYVYNNKKSQIASLSKVIAQQALDGDKEAKSYFLQAGRDMARFVLQNYYRLGFDEDVLIGLKGSVLLEAPYVQDVFIEEIRKVLPKANFDISNTPPSMGGYYMALKDMNKGLLKWQ